MCLCIIIYPESTNNTSVKLIQMASACVYMFFTIKKTPDVYTAKRDFTSDTYGWIFVKHSTHTVYLWNAFASSFSIGLLNLRLLQTLNNTRYTHTTLSYAQPHSPLAGGSLNKFCGAMSFSRMCSSFRSRLLPLVVVDCFPE